MKLNFLIKKSKGEKRQKLSNAERIQSYSELKVGDYVVHVNHGIARYVGMETLDINGVHKDYLLLVYQGEDKLFIPVDQLDLVQKYVGAEGKSPRLNKLGGAEWKRVKKKVQASVQDIADDLIKLYAEREAEKGYAFSADDEMQREFEEAFPYQETDDQLRSISEIKKTWNARARWIDFGWRCWLRENRSGFKSCFQSNYGWQASCVLSPNDYFGATTL